jgi:hypothetical protein
MPHPVYWIAGTAVIATLPATITIKSLRRILRREKLFVHRENLGHRVGDRATDEFVERPLPANVIDPKSLL